MTGSDVRTRAHVEVQDRARPVSLLYRVTVLDDGFRYEGWEFRSLSKLASEITGAASLSGFPWMELTGGTSDAPKPKPAKSKRKSAASTETAPAPVSVADVPAV